LLLFHIHNDYRLIYKKQTLKATMECGMRVLPEQTRSSVATTVSQLKIYDFSGEAFKGFEVL